MAQTIFAFTNLTTSTGQLIRSGPGLLASVTINTRGSTASSIHLRDATSSGTGSPIATIEMGAAIGTLVYDVVLTHGLHLSNSTSTADYTVEWA